MTYITWIIPEKISASDESFEILNLLVNDGAKVSSGQIIAECEGAKSIFEIETSISGFFYSTAHEKDVIEVGDPIGFVSSTRLEKSQYPLFRKKTSMESSPEKFDDFNASKSAIELAKKLNFDLSKLSYLRLITTNDIKKFIGSKGHEEKVLKNDSIERILFIGGGNGAISARECLKSNQSIVAVVDDNQNKLEKFGIKSLGKIDLNRVQSLYSENSFDSVFITMTSNIELREKYFSFLMNKSIRLSTLIHKQAYIADSASIGQGSLILDSARLGPESYIGELCFVSAFVNIEHHSIVGRNVTFGPGVFLSGEVVIGNNCKFGTGIFVEPKISIGNNCTIASMNLISRDIPDNSTVKNVLKSKIINQIPNFEK